MSLFSFACPSPSPIQEEDNKKPEKKVEAPEKKAEEVFHLEVKIEEKNSSWDIGGDDGFGERYAILIGVGDYKHHPSWKLAFVKKNLEELKKHLMVDLKFSGGNIVEVSGTEATRDTIIDTLENSLYKRLRGKNNLILVYYVGHGFISEGDKHPYFLTYHTTGDQNKRYTYLLSDTDFGKAVSTLKGKLGGEVGIQPVFIFDACQSKGMAPEVFDARPMAIEEVVITSAEPGQYALPNEKDDMSLFTDRLCQAMEEEAKGSRVTIERLFERVKKSMEREAHHPQLRGKEKEIELFSRKAIPLRFEVYSALRPSESLNASIKINEREYTAPVSLNNLEEGENFLAVSCKGYFPKMEKIQITAGHRNKTCKVYLNPEVSVVWGRVIEKSGLALGLEAAILGSFEGMVEGYHKQKAQIEGGKYFQLVVPSFEEGRELVISQNQKILYLRGLHSFEVSKVGGYDVRVYSAGEIEIQSGQEGDLSGEVNFADEESQQTYQILQGLFGKEKYDSAMTVWEEAYQKAQKGNQESAQKKFYAVGYRICQKPLEEGLKKGIERGDFSLADRAMGEVKNFYREEKRFLNLMGEIERERISLETRVFYQKASKAFQMAQMEDSEENFQKALFGANAHYKKKIEAYIKYLRGRLYLKYRILGFNAYLQDEWEKSARHFMKSFQYGFSASMLKLMEDNILPRIQDESLVSKYLRELGPVKEEAARREREEAERIAREKVERAREAKFAREFSYLGEKTYSCGGVTNTVKEYRHDSTGMEFVLVPAGSFEMGSNDGSSYEKPVHSVNVKSFLMSKYEVTQEVYEKIMGANPSSFKGSNLPVEQVSWEEAKKFCEKTGLALPTEAQWEYACRAGTRTKYYWGDSEDGDYMWYGSNSGSKTHPVGEKKPNAFGLYDMSGNVWEWCEDWYHSDYNNAPGDGSAWIYPVGSGRVDRGGSWDGDAVNCRSADRSWNNPSIRWYNLGFRVCQAGF